MNRQQQLLTALMVVLLLGLGGVLMTVASRPGGPDASSPAGNGTPEPSEADTPSPGTTSSPPPPTLPSPGPSPQAPDPDRPADPKPGKPRDLLPAAPSLSAGSRECIEFFAQRRALSVATFNIHGGLGNGGRNLDAIAGEISRWRPDVVLLQEVDRGRRRTGRQDQTQVLARRLGMTGVYQPASRKRGGGTIGNAVLSRFPVTDVRRVALPGRGAEPRGVMRVQLDVQSVPVAAYVTHLDHRSGTARQRQIGFIARAVRQEPLPVVVGGDLNAVPGSRVLSIARRELRDAWPAVGRGRSRTVPRARIDYLLHGDSLQPLAARVLGSRISDHDAVLASFQVSRLPGCGPGLLGDASAGG